MNESLRNAHRALGSPEVEFRTLLSEARRRVEARLGPWLEARVTEARPLSSEVLAVVQALSDLSLRGGKRMRAALVVAGYEVGSAESQSDHSFTVCEPAMMAIELLQTYLLIHDDWMDDDDVRRGGPAVHVILREQLKTRSLGDAGAILAGDLASGFAQRALLETEGVAAAHLLRAARAFARIQVDVVRGQISEMRVGEVYPHVEIVHELKTASYTVTGPLLLGASLAGADDVRLGELEAFGRPLGVAFQLRDDLLGIFGDPTATGKPVWNDIKQGKHTSLIDELRAHPRGRQLLDRAFGRADAPRTDLEEIVALLDSTGARERVEDRVRELCAESSRALDEMTSRISPLGAAWLRGAVAALGERSS